MVICLERDAHDWHYGPGDASLASLKSRLVQSFCCRLTEVVLEKRPLKGCLVFHHWKAITIVLLCRVKSLTDYKTARREPREQHGNPRNRWFNDNSSAVNYGHFGPKTLRTLDTSALVWWVRTVRTDRHWCRSVLKTVRT